MPSKRKSKSCKANENKGRACVFCLQDKDDERSLGKMYSTRGISAHYFCVLFACGLAQNGRSAREGICGFLVEDIQREVRRGKYWRCVYCEKVGATVGCFVKKCMKVFHFPCGLENGAMNQYFDRFRSFCAVHKPSQRIETPGSGVDCAICYGDPRSLSTETHLKSPCCVSGWFHRSCIQTYALSAGYFFKCPLCNESDGFRSEMQKYGINIPDRDASWEREQNAYGELLVRPECGAEKCECSSGRATNESDSLWSLVYCVNCGSIARHLYCEKLPLDCKEYTCSDCKILEKKFMKERKKKWLERMNSTFNLKHCTILLEDVMKDPGISRAYPHLPIITDKTKAEDKTSAGKRCLEEQEMKPVKHLCVEHARTKVSQKRRVKKTHSKLNGCLSRSEDGIVAADNIGGSIAIEGKENCLAQQKDNFNVRGDKKPFLHSGNTLENFLIRKTPSSDVISAPSSSGHIKPLKAKSKRAVKQIEVVINQESITKYVTYIKTAAHESERVS